MNLLINPTIIATTIEELVRVGKEDREGLVLWLADYDSSKVSSVHVPDYRSGRDFFDLSTTAMKELVQFLRASQKRIVAQVHSHPQEAFHSLADDKWALIKHSGALSLVLPDFCETVTKKNFREKVKIYEYLGNEWIECDFLKKAKVTDES